LLSAKTSAQIISFNHITQEYGLRNGNVRAIVKDYQGFVWIGTEDGLHRYDGYSMKVYRKIENDTASISSNFILCLFEDSNKNLWIGTLDGSLCLYNRKKDNFIHFKKQISKNDSRINEAIRAIYEDDSKQLFIGSGRLLRGVLTKNPESTQFIQVKLPTDTLNNAGIRIMDISEYKDGQLLMSVNNVGLFVYDKNTNKFTLHKIGQIEKNIQAIHIDKKRNLIWLGTWKNGLIVSDYAGEKYKRIKKGNDTHSLRHDFVPALAADSIGNLWIATDNGLSMITYKCNPLIEPVVETYLPDPQNHSSIQGSIIKAVYVDSDDNLWVGVYYEGVNLYYKHSTHFGTIIMSNENQATVDSRSVTALVEDRSHNLWVGTDGSGLYFSKDSVGKEDAAFEKITSCKGIDKIKAMKYDGDKNLWIGTWGNGLYFFNTQTRTCQNFESLKTGIDVGKEILSLEVDPVGDVRIGTFDKGFFRFNSKTQTAIHVENIKKSSDFIDRVNAITNGSNKTIWIGKEAGGLNKTSVGSNKYEVVEIDHIQASTSVSSIYVDKEETLWIGCPSKGLVQYDLKKNISTLYTEQDGLSNSVIYGILEDNMGRLWISTDAGISVFDKKNKQFVNFGKANGLLSNQFNRASILSTHNGYFAFGNIKGISYINPNQSLVGDRNSPIEFTKFFVNNREQLVNQSGSILKENISIAHEIQLDYNQNSFSFEVALLDYDFSRQSDYYYKLEEFDEGWQYAGVQRMIQYTKLTPGEYRLKVSSSNTGTNGSTATINIIIRPAWWQTTAFKIAVG
ncbi:MAG TPA: two-component regulator propeller domain-containing protein, partial [Cyclobacteriaceae bacterium]|nr:two-component regulator propeller domain-containing protein [Cyclobacteriaceae bacterium]